MEIRTHITDTAGALEMALRKVEMGNEARMLCLDTVTGCGRNLAVQSAFFNDAMLHGELLFYRNTLLSPFGKRQGLYLMSGAASNGDAREKKLACLRPALPSSPSTKFSRSCPHVSYLDVPR